MTYEEELKKRIEQIYRDVVATTPRSDTFSDGRLAKAYAHGIHMVAVHTTDLMVQRMIELIGEERQRKVSRDEYSGY